MIDVAELWTDLAADLEPAFSRFRRRLADLTVETKVDKTLLTEADVAIEQMIMHRIREFDEGAVIVAEEDNRTTTREDVLSDPERVWVVDPIDGTAEFVRPDRVEFCSVVCLLEHRQPVAAFVFAPELGPGRAPVLVVADARRESVTLNRGPVAGHKGGGQTASVTRSSDTPPRPFEAKLVDAGYRLKTSTTSQTLDMVRTALDLSQVDSRLSPFDLFFRPRQKIWDGLAGMCIGATVGLSIVDASGRGVSPVDVGILSQPEPTFETTVMGDPGAVAWFLEIVE